MSKRIAHYQERLKKMVDDSRLGDETLDADYDELYDSREPEEELDWDEDFDTPNEGVDSFSDVSESAQHDSVFDVNEEAYAESSEQGFTADDLEDMESFSRAVEENESFVIDDENDEDDYDDSLQERSSKKSSALDRISSGAVGFFDRIKDATEKNAKNPNKGSKKPKDTKNGNAQGYDESVFDVSSRENDARISEIVSKSKKSKKDRENAATDILEILGIPETFAIEERFYLPEDIKNIDFDEEAPIGYDRREVKKFVKNVRNTLEHFKDLLESRNSHIVTLAVEIDKKDDVISKMRYDREVAQGINIIPTQGDQLLENQITDLEVQISRLQSERDEARHRADGEHEKAQEAVGLSREERSKYNALQDDYSAVSSENDRLRQELSQMQARLRIMEEESTPDLSDSFVFEGDIPHDFYQREEPSSEEESVFRLPQTRAQ